MAEPSARNGVDRERRGGALSESGPDRDGDEGGERRSAEELLPEVYHELRALARARLAHEKPGRTIQATMLVHEAWLRIAGEDPSAAAWNGRGHFFGAAARAMEAVLVDHARRRGARPATGRGAR